VNLRANHRNTYGNRGSVTLGVGTTVSGGVNLRANHRNSYGNRGSVTLGVGITVSGGGEFEGKS